jgi:hypothetical protein
MKFWGQKFWKSKIAWWEESSDFLSLCVEFLFFEKNDFTFSIYRHVIAVRATMFTFFFSEAAIEAGFFSTSEPNTGT